MVKDILLIELQKVKQLLLNLKDVDVKKILKNILSLVESMKEKENFVSMVLLKKSMKKN